MVNVSVSQIADALEGPRGGQTTLLRDSQQAKLSPILHNECDSSQILQTDPSMETSMITSELYQPRPSLSDAVATPYKLNFDFAPMLCEQDCDCTCHRRRKIQSPSCLNTILGSLFIGYSINPWMTRKSHSTDCRGHSTSITYTYAFPQWLLSQMVRLRIAYDHSRGPELCLRVVRVRSEDAVIWALVKGGGLMDESLIIQELQYLFINGEASILDVDRHGSSALTVRYQPSSANNSEPDPNNSWLSTPECTK